MRKRILSILLCFVLVIGLLPTSAFAESEVFECTFCSNVYYGTDSSEFLCDDCGACEDCFEEMHCPGCTACYMTADWWCEECKKCIDCVLADEDHCMECMACYEGKEDELCGMCKQCDSCNYICPDCGLCEYCWSDSEDEMHCPICGDCYNVVGAADHEGAHHCEYCCSYCEQCGDSDTCTADDPSIEYCDECGLCVECCMENRNAAGCDEYCVESSEFEYHFCEECGECFCNKEQCSYCGLCTECCATNSDCFEGMCVEDSDYDDHFCPKCDKCFHEGGDQCSECGLCEDCCAETLGDAKVGDCCDDFSCVEQDGFAEHMAERHSGKGYTHTHSFAKSWSMDETDHWHACLSCEEGKNAEGCGKEGHTSSDGICTVCGYKSGAKVYFITQPSDAHVQVSDDNDGSWLYPGPTNSWNNRTSFRVKAFGKGLTYQWYQVKGSETTKLTDNKTKVGDLVYVSGATTQTLTISVGLDSCTANYSYYCVVTDRDGNTATSSVAKMIAAHRYTVAKNDETTKRGSIWLGTATNPQNRCQTTAGHKWYCCGTGHKDAPKTLNKVAKSHNFKYWGTVQGAYTKEALLAGNCITFNGERCTDCGFVKYVAEHECFMLSEQLAETDANVAKEHKLVCQTAGCDKTGRAPHKWEFEVISWPSEGHDGSVYRECTECHYSASFTWQKAEVTTGSDGKPTAGTKETLGWTTSNILVDVLYGTANCSLVSPGETVILTPELDGEHAFDRWEVRYFYGDDGREYTVSLDVTENTDGTWSCKIPTDFFKAQNVPGGGNLYFTGLYASALCTHANGTKTVGAKEQLCVYDGYTGDEVCKDCGKVMTEGKVIKAPEDATHPTEGRTEIPDTGKAATCTKAGRENDFTCSKCGHTVSGDKIDSLGHERKTENAKDATCTEKGYSGDIVCTREGCGKTLANGHETAALGHSWGTGVGSKQGKLTVVTHACTRTGCDATYTRVLRGEVLMGKGITSVNLNLTGYKLGGSITVKPDDDTAAKLTVGKVALYKRDPIGSNGQVDTDRLTSQLAATIREGETYYLLVPLMPKDDYTFHEKLTNKQITLNKVQRATKLGVMVDPKTKEEVKVAVFELKPLYGTYTVTMNGAGDGAFGTGSYRGNKTVTIDAGTKDGYTFKNWTSADGVTFADDTSAITTFKMPSKDVTVTANWTKNNDKKPTPPDHGSSELSYPITVENAENGNVTADRKSASAGTTVTVTVDPARGYTLETLTVLNGNGREVKLTDKGNGKYTFTMPASKVTVKATFMEDNSMLNFFVDVPADKYYYDAVLWAAENGIAGGVDAVHFAPNATCTRAQAVTFLWRAAGKPEVKSTVNPFSDVNENSTFYKAILWAVENGITKGTTETTFSPNAKCTRAQIMTFLWRSQKSPVISEANPFTDVKADAYYIDAVLWAAANAITGGTTATTFSPNANCTRAQIITFIYRCMK